MIDLSEHLSRVVLMFKHATFAQKWSKAKRARKFLGLHERKKSKGVQNPFIGGGGGAKLPKKGKKYLYFEKKSRAGGGGGGGESLPSPPPPSISYESADMYTNVLYMYDVHVNYIIIMNTCTCKCTCTCTCTCIMYMYMQMCTTCYAHVRCVFWR